MPENPIKELAQIAVDKGKSEADFITALRKSDFNDSEISQALGYYNGLNVKKKDLPTSPSSLVEASVVSKSRPASEGYGLEYPTQVPKAEVKSPTSDGKDLLRGKSTPKVEGAPDITEAPPSYDWRKAAIAGRIIEMDSALKTRADILEIQKSQTEQPKETGGRQYELAVRDNTAFAPNVQDLSALFDAQDAKYADNLSAVKRLGEQVYGADAVSTQTWDDGIERVSPEQTERMLNEGLVEMDKHNKYLDNLVRTRQQEVGSVSFDNMLGEGFKTLGAGLVELSGTPMPVGQIAALQNEITTRAANLNQGVSSENVDKSIVELFAIGDVGDGLTKLKNSVYQQIPQVALAIVAPEYALPALAASAGGSTWGDIKYRPDLNTAEKLTLAVGAGVAEYAFEKLFMGDIKTARRSLGLDEVGNLPVDKVKSRLSGVIDVAKNFGEEAIEEGGVEVTNQILANIIANEQYNPIAVADAMIIGGVSGGSTVGVTTALAKGASAIGTHRTAGVKVNLNKESRQIQTLLQDPNISHQERSALEQKLNDVIKQGVDLANDELRFYEQFDEADANEMLSINQQVKNNIGAINKSTNPDSKAILMEQTKGLLERKKQIEQKYINRASESQVTKKVKVYHGGSVNDIFVATKQSPVFVSESEEQAQEYAKGNDGNVSAFDIDEKSIATEEQARDVINKLELKSGQQDWDVDELNLFELIDPSFDTSLSEQDIERLYSELESMGYSAIRFTDTNLKTNKQDIDNIVVFSQYQVPKTGTQQAVEVTDDTSIDNVLSQVWKSKTIPQERKTTVARSIASLKKAVPKKKVILHTTRESFEDAVGVERGKGQGAAGANTTDAIHINLTDTNSNTALHEVLHDVYAEQNKGYVDKISDKIFRAVSKDAQLKAKYVNFLKQYKQGERSEEFFAEFWSDVASGDVEIEFVKDYIQGAKDAVAKFIGKITGVEPKLSDRDFVKLMDAYVKNMRTNEAPKANLKNVRESDNYSTEDRQRIVFQKLNELSDRLGDAIPELSGITFSNEPRITNEERFKKYKKAFGETAAKAIRSNMSLAYDNEDALIDFISNKIPIKSNIPYIVKEMGGRLEEEFIGNTGSNGGSSNSPEALLRSVGYKFNEPLKTLDEAEQFRFFYSGGNDRVGGSVICTYGDPDRPKQNFVMFLVRDNAENIKRANELTKENISPEWAEYLTKVGRKNTDGSFNLDGLKPNREDPFSTSVLSVQINKSNGYLKIVSRYNHDLPHENPDATFNKDLNQIVDGLDSAIYNYIGVNKNKSEFPPNITVDSQNRYFRYTQEESGVYFGDGFYIQDAISNILDPNTERLINFNVVNSNGKHYNVLRGENIVLRELNKAVFTGKDTVRLETNYGNVNIKLEDGKIVETDGGDDRFFDYFSKSFGYNKSDKSIDGLYDGVINGFVFSLINSDKINIVNNEFVARFVTLKSLSNLHGIGGSAYFRDSQVQDLSSLQSIDGSAYFERSQVQDLSSLQSIGGDADFRDSQVQDLSSLRSIGGSAYFRDSQVNKINPDIRIDGIIYSEDILEAAKANTKPKFQLNSSDTSKAFDFYIKSTTNKKEFVNGVRSMYDITVKEAEQLYDRAKAFFRGYRTGYGFSLTDGYKPKGNEAKDILASALSEVDAYFVNGNEKEAPILKRVVEIINSKLGEGSDITENNLKTLMRINDTSSQGVEYSKHEKVVRAVEQVAMIVDSINEQSAATIVEQIDDMQQDVSSKKQRDDANRKAKLEKKKQAKKGIVEYARAIAKAKSRQRQLRKRVKKRKIEDGVKSTYRDAIITASQVIPNMLSPAQLGDFLSLMSEINSAIGNVRFERDLDTDTYDVFPYFKDTIIPSHRNAVDLNSSAGMFLALSNSQAIKRRNKAISNAASIEAAATGRPFQEVYDELVEKLSRGASLKSVGFSSKLIDIANQQGWENLNSVERLQEAMRILSEQLQVEYEGKVDALKSLLSDIMKTNKTLLNQAFEFVDAFGGEVTDEKIDYLVNNLNLAALVRLEAFVRNFIVNGQTMGFGSFSKLLAAQFSLNALSEIPDVKNKSLSLRRIPIAINLMKVKRSVTDLLDNFSLVFSANLANVSEVTLAKIRVLLGAEDVKMAVTSGNVEMSEAMSAIRAVINDFSQRGINVVSFENQAMQTVFSALRQRPAGLTQVQWFLKIRKTVENALNNPQRKQQFTEEQKNEYRVINDILNNIFNAVNKESETPIDDALSLFPDHVREFVDEFVKIHSMYFPKHARYTESFLGRVLNKEDNYTPFSWEKTGDTTLTEKFSSNIINNLTSAALTAVKKVTGSSIDRTLPSESTEMRFDFININESSLSDTIYTYNVAPSMIKFEAIMSSDKIVELIPNDVIRNKITAAVRKLVASPVLANHFAKQEVSFSAVTRTIQSFMTLNFLAGISQIPKQSLVVLTSLTQMSQSGAHESLVMLKDLVEGKIIKKRSDGKGVVESILRGDKENVFEDFKTYISKDKLNLLKMSPVYFRDYDNALISAASSKFVERLASDKLRYAHGVRESLQAFSLGALTGTDKVATIVSWFGFYRSYFDKEGIEWNGWDAKPNMSAISYADMKVDKDHAPSTTQEGSDFQGMARGIANKKLAAIIQLARFNYFPFAVFAINRLRYTAIGFNQAAFATNKTARVEGRNRAMRNLAEGYLFANLSVLTNVLIINGFASLFGDDDDKYSELEKAKMYKSARERGVIESILPVLLFLSDDAKKMVYKGVDKVRYWADKATGNWDSPAQFSTSDKDALQRDYKLWQSTRSMPDGNFNKGVSGGMIGEVSYDFYSALQNIKTITENNMVTYTNASGEEVSKYLDTDEDKVDALIAEASKVSAGLLSAAGFNFLEVNKILQSQGRNAKLFYNTESEEAIKRMLDGDFEMIEHMIVSKATAEMKATNISNMVKVSDVIERDDVRKAMNYPKYFYDYKRMLNKSATAKGNIEAEIVVDQLVQMKELLDLNMNDMDAIASDIVKMIVVYRQNPEVEIRNFLVVYDENFKNAETPERGESEE